MIEHNQFLHKTIYTQKRIINMNYIEIHEFFAKFGRRLLTDLSVCLNFNGFCLQKVTKGGEVPTI